jgi:hypothetical protein
LPVIAGSGKRAYASRPPFPGNGIFKPETRRARRLRSFEDGFAETKPTPATPPIRG